MLHDNEFRMDAAESSQPKKRGHGEKDSNFAQTISSGSIVLQQIKRRRRK